MKEEPNGLDDYDLAAIRAIHVVQFIEFFHILMYLKRRANDFWIVTVEL